MIKEKTYIERKVLSKREVEKLVPRQRLKGQMLGREEEEEEEKAERESKSEREK